MVCPTLRTGYWSCGNIVCHMHSLHLWLFGFWVLFLIPSEALSKLKMIFIVLVMTPTSFSNINDNIRLCFWKWMIKPYGWFDCSGKDEAYPSDIHM